MLGNNVNRVKSTIVDKAKTRIFDIVAAGIILAAAAIILGVFEPKEISKETLFDIGIEFIPLFLTSILLSQNYYNKGVFVGKGTDAFSNIVKLYSSIVSSLTGEQVGNLCKFCDEYNETTLNKIKELELKKVAIPFDLYDKGDDTNKPLKVWSKKQLKAKYEKHVWKTILHCKHIKIKGLKVNNLLGNEDIDDRTDLGKTEKELRSGYMLKTSIMYIVCTLVLTLIAIKDIQSWGWTSLILISFKILYIFFRAYMTYFDGYNHITVSLSNHIARKTDILKEFQFWHKNNFEKDNTKVETTVIN